MWSYVHTRHTRVHTIWMAVNIYIHTHTYIYIYTYTCRHIIYINILDAGSLACFNLGVYATRPQNTEQRNTMEDPEQRWWGFPQVIVGQVHQNSSPVLMQRRTICMETGNSTLIFDVFQYAFALYNNISWDAKEVYLHKFKDLNKSWGSPAQGIIHLAAFPFWPCVLLWLHQPEVLSANCCHLKHPCRVKQMIADSPWELMIPMCVHVCSLFWTTL